MNTAQIHQLFLHCSGVSTDTREIKADSIFFALKGENFNGNAYAREALEKGARYAVIDEQVFTENREGYIVVENALETLQALARFHRKYLGIPILAITGSNGKTTTKELVNEVLSKKYRTVATRGNLNNHIGVPLTLLSMDNYTEFGIVEMGANHPKEIEFLCDIAFPDYGYITNFGKAHLEGFGSLEGVIIAKSELYDHLKENNQLIFLNLDDQVQQKHLSYNHHFGFGTIEDANVHISYPKAAPHAQLKFNHTIFKSQLTGSYNSYNIAAALTIGLYFKVPLEDIKEAIENYQPQNNRSQTVDSGTNTVLLDAYNANPTSMVAAIESFIEMDSNKIKKVILGDMFELGPGAVTEHQVIVNLLENSPISEAYLVGEHFYNTQTDSDSIKRFRNFEDLKLYLETERVENSHIMVKGSRAMALERVLDIV